MAGRGQITEEIQAKAMELLDWEDMTQHELRMLPYIQYCLVNQQNLDPNKYHREDIRYMKRRGWIVDPSTDLGIEKEFWDAMCELIMMGYVDNQNRSVGEPCLERTP